MSIAEILKLIDAGFTKDEIMALTKVADSEKIEHQQTKVENDAEKQTEVKEEAKQDPEPKPEPQESETEKLVKALGLKFDNLAAAIQKSNVNGLEMPTDTMTVESIIAGMIDPKYNDKGGK